MRKVKVFLSILCVCLVVTVYITVLTQKAAEQLKKNKVFVYRKGSIPDIGKTDVSESWVGPLKSSDECPKLQQKNGTSQACIIPQVDPFHPSIMKYIKKIPLPICEGVTYGTLVNGTMVHDDSVSSISYRTVKRVEDSKFEFGPKIEVNSSKIIPEEYIEVEYVLKDKKKVSDVLCQMLPKKELLERKGTKKAGLPYNILIIVVDSLSTSNIQRKLPKLYKYLKDDLKALIFKGHTITGDGTSANLTPLLTGKHLEEQPEARQGEGYYKNAGPLDGWNWIWKNLTKDYGYLTGFSEDGVHPGPFQYRLKGFKEPPTDFYPRPFFLAAARGAISKYSKKRHYVDRCINNRNIATVHLDYVKQIFDAYKNNLKFYLSFNAAYSHNNLNLGEKMEGLVEGLIKKLKDAGHLNNTILVVMGDHGVRFGDVRTELQGVIEERLPLYSMIMPQSFRDKYPDLMTVLQRNTERLTTWFDVHKTFHHILSYPQLPTTHKRAYSLFTDISENRTCEQAGIPSHYCPCLEWISIAANHSQVIRAAETTVRYLNHLLAQTNLSTSMCHNLTLKRTNFAQIERPSNDLAKVHSDVKNFKQITRNFCRYRLQFTTSPNNGIYEATVKVQDKKFILSTDISRVNRYGDQPSCIADRLPFLRKYCLCKDYKGPLF